MTDLHKAAQQALEALTHGCPPDCTDGMTDSGGVHPWGEAVLVPCPTCTAIADLRAALAQQDAPEAYGYASRLAVAIWEKHYKDTAPQWKPLDDLMGVLTQIDNMTSGLTLLAQQAEPVEPVAIVRWNDIGHISWRTQVMLPDNTLLYTAPPQRKPLTEEVAALTAQRDALLEALRDLVQLEADGRTEYESAIPHWDAARAAIKAVEETK